MWYLFAGQINGTSGYESSRSGAGCRINAKCYLKENKPLTLNRDEAYIGVMIDDLITKDTDEPYRMSPLVLNIEYYYDFRLFKTLIKAYRIIYLIIKGLIILRVFCSLLIIINRCYYLRLRRTK